MAIIYYYWILLNAGASFAVAGVAYWKNRFQAVGPLFGLAFLFVGIWLIGFAQYFRPMNDAPALWWAKFTLTAAIINHPFVLHSFCALVGQMKRWRWWIGAAYIVTAFFLVLLWMDVLIIGLKQVPFMHHYIRYNRAWYPYLGVHLTIWEFLGTGILGYSAWKAASYRRVQLFYFIIVWLICFLTTNLIVLPLEYDINVQPFGFLLLPVNLVLLAYVMSKARLPDVNVVIARVLVYAVTLLVVVALSLVFVGITLLLQPDFMTPQQVYFNLLVVVVIGSTLAFTLPRFFPMAERMVQERIFGGRPVYQDMLAGLVKELSRASSLDQMLETVATTTHSNMQVTRVLIFLQNPLTDEFRLHAQSGLDTGSLTDGMTLTDSNPSVRWLREHKDALVQDEVARVLPPAVWSGLAKEFDHFKVTLYVPMLLEDRLVGVIALGEKLNRDMFYVSDLRLLGTLATEVALGVRYRRMEEQAVRNNKLIELGTIAAGIAHEIRNPLASIRTFAQLLPTKTDDPDFKNAFAKMVVQDVDRITRVIQSMLSFARPGTVNVADHAASELVEEALTLMQSRLKNKNITVTKSFHEQLLLRVDKQQIIQVLLNLLNNATDALSSEGQIRITTGVHRVEETKGQSGQRIGVIEIADNGPGIPVAARSRLFDPFFTTKKDGTGLGLSISQKIVRDHNGLITVSSVEGHGATFQVHLPLA